MRFSVITPSLNQGRFIADCIDSVLRQDYDDIEHIIVDGGSSDETSEVLKGYSHLKIITGIDSGPANAINKGFRIASGEVLSWLNADDYYEEKVFGKLNLLFKENSDLQFLYGNLTFVDINKNILYKDKTRKFDFDSLVNTSPDIRQPCSFYRRELVVKANFLNEKIKTVFDYDLFIKMSKHTVPFYLDENLAYYRDYADTLTRKNIRIQGMEIFKISRSYGARLFSPLTKISLKRILKGKL